MNILLCFFLNFTIHSLLFSEAANIQRFVAPFHKVNDKTADGRSCKELYDPREVFCPQLAVAYPGSYDKFTLLCSSIAPSVDCPRDQYRFIDGVCRPCPSGMRFVSTASNTYCEDVNGNKAHDQFINPTNCQGEKYLPRHTLDYYRPCYAADALKVVVPNYYRGDDLMEELTMEHCAKKMSLQEETVISQNGKTTAYKFPLIRDRGTAVDTGLLKCPLRAQPAYSYATPGWIFVHSVLGLTGVWIISFAVYKFVFEKYIAPKANRSAKINEMTQIGYKESYFGFGGFLSVIVITVGFQLLMFMYVLDLYGMHLHTICGNESIKAECEVQARAGKALTWRTGYECASGCVFDMNLTNGFYEEWPYEALKGGGKRQQLAFLIIWGLAIVWTISVRVASGGLRCFFRLNVPLNDATYVFCKKPEEKEVTVAQWEENAVMRTVRYFQSWQSRIFGPPTITQTCKVQTDGYGHRYIDIQCVRCVWMESDTAFVRTIIETPKCQQHIVEQSMSGLSSDEALKRRKIVGDNSIDIKVPSFIMSLYYEFFDYFYFYQFFCLWIWFNFYYWPMGILIATTVIISGLLRVVVRRNSQKRVKRIAEMSTEVEVYRDKTWIKIQSCHLAPGDSISIEPNSNVTCDLVLTDGRCVVDESSLTGEPTPVPKVSVTKSSASYVKTGACMKYTVLAGTYVESVSSSLSFPGRTVGCVIDTGAETDKGKFIRNILFPARMTFVFDEHWKAVFFILLGWGIITGIITVLMYGGLLEGYYLAVFNVSQVLSPIIPAMFVAGEVKASKRLKSIKIFCVNLHRIVVAGKVKIFCFDKTGTLTKTGMDFYGVQSIMGNAFGPFFAASAPLPLPVAKMLGSCHELDVCETTSLLSSQSVVRKTARNTIETFRWWPRRLRKKRQPSLPKKEDHDDNHPVGNDDATKDDQAEGEKRHSAQQYPRVVGNEVDKEMFFSSGFEMAEVSLRPVVTHTESNTSLTILRRFEFSRESMTMSVIVEEEGGERYVYCKGSFETIAKVTKNTPSDYESRTRQLAKEGFYLLGISSGKYTGPEDVSLAERNEVENGLDPVGLLMFRNDIKPDSEDAILALREAAIKTVMITGDNALTATKIAKQASLSSACDIILGEIDPNDLSNVVWRNLTTDENVPHPDVSSEILHRGEAELAVTGDAFEVLRRTPAVGVGAVGDENKATKGEPIKSRDCITQGSLPSVEETLPFQSEMDHLLDYTSIFARMKPHQKVDAVLMQMSRGITGMCGDGANDAGALRAAHCGVALASGDSDASVVAPFSTSQTSIFSIVECVRYGRAALATSVAGYKQLILYGQIMTILTLCSNAFGIITPEPLWITWDGLVNIGMVWAILQTRPAKRLAPHRPTACLLGLEIVTSVVLQVIVAWLYMSLAVVLLFKEPWFACKEFDANRVDSTKWWLKGDNYEGYVLGLVALLQFLTAGPVFSYGFDYRRTWVRNWSLMALYVAGVTLVLVLLFADATFVNCLYRVNCGDMSLLELWSKEGWLGSSSVSKTFTTPTGCSCSEQIVFNSKCEAEYINCTADQFNQIYHHNIAPMSFRGKLVGLMIGYVLTAMLTEGVFVVGPVRRRLRQYNNKSNLLSITDTPHSSIEMIQL